MTRLPNQYLTALTDRRINQRDRLIRQQGREIARWSRSVEERLLGIIHADRGGREGVTGSVDAFLLGIPISASELLAGKLVEMWDWSWDSAVDIMVRAVPMEVWVARMAPLRVGEADYSAKNLQQLSEAGIKGGEAGRRFRDREQAALAALGQRFFADPDYHIQEVVFEPEIELAAILAGTATPAEARALVARFEFPAPSADRVEAILRTTNAPDGLDAMTRIKTVIPQDLDRLRSTIVSAMSAPDRASAIQALAPQIREMVGGIHYKAQRIARTEGMRIAEAGQDECDSQVDDMITGYKAMTAFDANVRREHRVWHDQLYKRIAQGRYVDPTLGDLPQFPAGPNCVLPRQSVSGIFTGGLDAFYSGQVVEAIMRSGRTLTVTPNHPVLTKQGFVPARTLRNGDELLCHNSMVELPAFVTYHEDHAPPQIQEVFQSLARRFFGSTHSTASADFHGDERAVKGQIKVVDAHRLLDRYGEPLFEEGSGESDFIGSDVELSSESGYSPSLFGGSGIRPAAASFPGSGHLLADSKGVASHPIPLGLFGFGLIANIHACLLEPLNERPATDAELFGQLVDRFSGKVATDRVVQIRSLNYVGHVYDLQTELGWYSVNGIILHNCRCWKVAQLATDLTRGLPPVQLGGQYGRALARFKRQGLAGFEKRVAPAKRAAKRVVRPRPKKKVPRKKMAPPLRVSPYKKEPIPKPRPKRLPQRSAAQREAIIQKQEQAIAAQKLEQLTAYDQDGNVRFHAFGTKNQVRMTTAQYKSMEGSITLHNHPAGSTFSAADIIGGALRNEAETRVITTRFRFQMKYKDVWGTLNHKERLAKAEALKRVYNAESIKAAKSVVPGIKAGNLTVTQGIEVAGHKLWTVLAEKFDLLYARTAL